MGLQEVRVKPTTKNWQAWTRLDDTWEAVPKSDGPWDKRCCMAVSFGQWDVKMKVSCMDKMLAIHCY